MKTALLLTGSFRTFDIMYEYINNNLVIPNSSVIFIYAEHYNEKDFQNKFNKNNIGIIKVLSSCKTDEYNKLFTEINNKNFPNLKTSKPDVWKLNNT